jgi:hypothetical protein
MKSELFDEGEKFPNLQTGNRPETDDYLTQQGVVT